MNLKRVYISGPDCTGKTTFAKALALATGMRVTKFSYEKTEEGQKRNWEAFKQIANSKDNVILDRGWHGPFCYTGILGEQPFDLIEMLSFSRQFVRNGGTIMLFDAASFVLKQRHKERGDEYITGDQLDKIAERYKQLASLLTNHDIPFYVIDTSNCYAAL